MAYAEEPYTDEHIQFYVAAWRQLATCRQIGMDVGPVPWDAIDRWTSAHGLDDEAAGLVEHVIRFIEGEHAAAKEKKDAIAAIKGNRR